MLMACSRVGALMRPLRKRTLSAPHFSADSRLGQQLKIPAGLLEVHDRPAR
jgi:hypothetical protein